MDIKIDEELLKLTPDFRVGVIKTDIEIYDENQVDSLIKKMEENIDNTINILDVVNLKTIIDGRNAYKKYGKDPSRYRLSVESLYRRLSKGNKLYRVNNVVDIGNVISLKTRRSVAVLDYDKISSDIVVRLGNENDEYYGIGRGKINIKNIPIYADSKGAFGSTTSDTKRTMITENTKTILVFIISFNGTEKIEEELIYAEDLYRKYAKATNISKWII